MTTSSGCPCEHPVASVRRERVVTDMAVDVGSIRLANPVMTAAGTSGHGAELDSFFPLRSLGAVVVKSLSADPWDGNPAPRVHEIQAGMLNSVGLQNPGVEAWLAEDLPALEAAGATVVASIWGTSIEAYERAATLIGKASPVVVAVEVNVSCPNIEDRRRMFAHSCEGTAAVMAATAGCGRPRWAKLSPNVTDLVDIAGSALDAGAEAVTLVNTLMGMAIDTDTGAYRLGSGAGGGGVSGAALHPIAVRAVHDCRKAHPDAVIIGVGGVSRGVDAAELILAGADAVQVGTATFADPRAPARVLAELEEHCARHRVARIRDLRGAVR